MAGVICVSTGAMFVRFAEAHPIVKSAYRLGFASLIIVPIALLTRWREYRELTAKDYLVGVLSGFFLAAHFASWITSIDYTTVASSLVLVNTAPVWVALINMFLGRGRPTGVMLACIAMSVTGAVMVGYGDLAFSGRAVIGDALALVGAIAVSLYIICGGELRKKLGLLSYTALCYGTAAVVMWTAAIGMGLTLTGFSQVTWGSLIGMALVAQILGHGSYNWALGHFNVVVVSIVLLGEPVMGSVLAYFLFNETITSVRFAGCVVLMLSIALLSMSSGKQHVSDIE
ncbi:MAG: DMT family transporter [Synergistaceae bacterium]|jgi:drug/metabolite transporter (DMT)-like permease|nr:DMT family transporter [Synergistaceae bacterium]